MCWTLKGPIRVIAQFDDINLEALPGVVHVDVLVSKLIESKADKGIGGIQGICSCAAKARVSVFHLRPYRTLVAERLMPCLACPIAGVTPTPFFMRFSRSARYVAAKLKKTYTSKKKI